MRKILRASLTKATSFEDVLAITLEAIAQKKVKNPNIRIGYVAGKVTTDGIQNIKQNLDRLHLFTDETAKEFDGLVFSAADVFNDEIYWKINLARPVHEEEFYQFWRQIIRSGVTDIFMTPEWEKSTGAFDEHSTAIELGIDVHYLK